MRSEAEIQAAIVSFQRRLSLRLDQMESLDADDRLYLVRLAKLQKEIKELELKIQGLKWVING